MKDVVIHGRSGLLLDFAEEDFGGEEQAAIVGAWQRGSHRVEPGEFICYRHRSHERPWLYLQQRGQVLIAAHWPGTALAGTHEISHGVSDEHKRQVEYVQAAGEAAGYRVELEVSLPTKVRSDAVVYGTAANMAVEVQRSSLAVSAAKARTTKARRAGVQPIWFSDNRSDPAWLWKVPGVRMMDMPWDKLPPRRSVPVVSGVRIIVPKQCSEIRNGQCPNRRYGCNRWHTIHAPRLNTLVDDLAALVPAGELVPILYKTPGGREYVLVVSPNDKARYEAVAGESAAIPLASKAGRIVQPLDRLGCLADAGSAIGPTLVCCQGGPSLPRCQLCPSSPRYWRRTLVDAPGEE